jgi:hypothetical protein
MDKILTLECLNKISGNNVEFVLGLLQYLNGRETEVFIKERVSVNHVVNRKIYVKFVHWIYSLGYRCRLEIKGVGRMVNTYLMKILLILIV